MQANQSTFPTWYDMALDYLPIQASAVPCERVFSSASDTEQHKRTRISPALMEALQVLKFSLRGQRGLDFTGGWQASTTDLEQCDPEGDLLQKFAAAGDHTTLNSLMDELEVCLSDVSIAGG